MIDQVENVNFNALSDQVARIEREIQVIRGNQREARKGEVEVVEQIRILREYINTEI